MSKLLRWSISQLLRFLFAASAEVINMQQTEAICVPRFFKVVTSIQGHSVINTIEKLSAFIF
jgi:hypothetical protein